MKLTKPKLTIQQRRAVFAIPNDGHASEPLVARALGMYTGAAGFARVLNELERKGFLIRFFDPDSGYSVRLTRLGRIYKETNP